MKHSVMLTVLSLLSILFVTSHLTSDTVHAKVGTPEAGGSTLVLVPILVVWLYGSLVLAERRSGYIIMLVGSLLALGMPVIHMMGAKVFFTARSPSPAQPSCLSGRFTCWA
jgi:UDP-N-acetylmuramyl pentapeptide phosphotransferase/UDP-N-acetylglucosamine-1-phosphate transferase